MRSAILGFVVGSMVSVQTSVGFGQGWSLPALRLNVNNATDTLVPPTAGDASASLILQGPDDNYSFDDGPANDQDDIEAYVAVAANGQVEDGIGSCQTTGSATCSTATDASDFVPAVDTLITGLLSKDNENGEGEGDMGSWSNSAEVQTQFQVQNRAGYDAVGHANLEGSIKLSADITISKGQYVVPFGGSLTAHVGGSSLTAVFLGVGNGWYLSGTLTRTSSENPNAEAESVGESILLDNLDEDRDCSEYIAVPSNQSLGAQIQGGGQLSDDCDGDATIKASAFFSVTAVVE